MFLYLVTVVFADFACHSYQHNILELYLVHLLFLVVALATTVSALVDEGTDGLIKVQHRWKEQLSCSGSVDEGLNKNSESVLIYLCIALVHSYAVADPERDPRVPWIPPFRLNIACKNRTSSNLQRSNSLSQLALLSCLYSLAPKLKIIIRKLEPSSLVHAAAG